MKFSTMQTAIFDWVKAHLSGAAALIVEAVAGSGKTTTIVEAAKLIPPSDSAVFLAFNKAIAQELAKRLPSHVEACTLNALGWRILRQRLNLRFDAVDRNKTRDLIYRNLPDEAQDVRYELASLIAKAKAHGMVPRGFETHPGTYESSHDEWHALMLRYGIDHGDAEFSNFVTWAESILDLGIRQTRVVDFDDQLYLPVVLGLSAEQRDWVIIDEAQDVSHVQRALLRKVLKRDGRLIAVGDSHQAIYGFRGADSESLRSIEREFSAERLPLSMTYRCPRKVVEVAQGIVPEITCPDNAPEGSVETAKEWSVNDWTDSDLVVCRMTAPLIELAYRAIGQGVPARVMGRDLGKGLVALVAKVAGRTNEIERFAERLDAWREREIRRAGDDEDAQSRIEDRVRCVDCVLRASGAESVRELKAAIESIFTDSRSGVTLATVHKAKGLEAQRVFILQPELMPCPWARDEWQIVQEYNIKYVAVTRALEALIYLPLDVVV